MEISISKEQQLILLGLVVSIIIGLGVMTYRQFAGSAGQEIAVEADSGAKEGAGRPTAVIIHLSGAIRREGVYRLNLGDRLMDAIALAGGAANSADLSAINLAEQVKDGQKINIPFKIEAAAKDVGPGINSAQIHLNSADEKALDDLPGVGAQTAKTIVEYRRKNGPFSRIEQLMEIPRFGKSKFERIKDRITL